MLEKIAAIRAQLTDTRERLDALDELGVPRADWLARLEDAVDRRAEEARERMAYELSAWRVPDLRGPGALFSGRIGQHAEAVAAADLDSVLLALLGPEAVKARLAELVAGVDYDQGPPIEERPRIRAELKAEIERLEIQEELAIRAAEAAGLEPIRRGDATAALVLAWDDDLAAMTQKPKRGKKHEPV